MFPRLIASFAAAATLLGGCAELRHDTPVQTAWNAEVRSPGTKDDGWQPIASGWGRANVVHTPVQSTTYVEPVVHEKPHAVAETDGPYYLDTGDKLRVFIYGQPNLSRLYTVDHAGKVVIPLIGPVKARGRTIYQLAGTIRGRLGAKYVRDPQVTVDVYENRPFFILGEVRNAGQFPYVNGMTVQTAVAIAGGFSERADEHKVKVTRRINGVVDVFSASTDYVLKPGDTVTVRERFL